jgi:hypothetical protein
LETGLNSTGNRSHTSVTLLKAVAVGAAAVSFFMICYRDDSFGCVIFSSCFLSFWVNIFIEL